MHFDLVRLHFIFKTSMKCVFKDLKVHKFCGLLMVPVLVGEVLVEKFQVFHTLHVRVPVHVRSIKPGRSAPSESKGYRVGNWVLG